MSLSSSFLLPPSSFLQSVAPKHARPKTLAKSSMAGGLPQGWAATLDMGSGDTYYYHEETGETQWEVPGT